MQKGKIYLNICLDTGAQSLRVLSLKNEFVQTNDIYPATNTHLETQKQGTVKLKRSSLRKKWHISIKKSFKN